MGRWMGGGKNCSEKLHSKEVETRAVHCLSWSPMNTAVVEDTIPGRCHPFGVLHRHHHVNHSVKSCLLIYGAN